MRAKLQCNAVQRRDAALGRRVQWLGATLTVTPTG
jgi:hypothetical protein